MFVIFYSWSCAQCTLKNEAKVTNCTACGAARASLENLWICKHCNKANSSDKVSCSQCGTKCSAMADAIYSNCVPVLPSDDSTWPCQNCPNKYNPYSVDVCDVCNAPKPAVTPQKDEELWQCFYCSHYNKLIVSNCVNCNRSRRPCDKPIKAVSASWTCETCTFNNNLADVSCIMCETPRGMRVVKPPPTTTVKPHNPLVSTGQEIKHYFTEKLTNVKDKMFPHKDDWICEHCRSRNRLPSEVCSVCCHVRGVALQRGTSNTLKLLNHSTLTSTVSYSLIFRSEAAHSK